MDYLDMMDGQRKVWEVVICPGSAMGQEQKQNEIPGLWILNSDFLLLAHPSDCKIILCSGHDHHQSV